MFTFSAWKHIDDKSYPIQRRGAGVPNTLSMYCSLGEA